MGIYNDTFLNTSINIADIVSGINTASDGILAIILLIIIWVMLFIVTKQYDTKVSLLISSFSVSLIGVFMLILGWITFTILIIPIVMVMFSLLALLFFGK